MKWLNENQQAVSAIASVVSALFTIAIAFLTFAVWQSYRRLNFITGAMQSHSEKQLRLAALGCKIPVIWVDKAKLKSKPTPNHGDPAPLVEIGLVIARPEIGWYRWLCNRLAG